MNKAQSLLAAVALLSMGPFSYDAIAEETGDASAVPEAAGAPEVSMDEHIARAVFTTNVQDREPTDTVTSLANDKDHVYFFSELRGLGGQTILHRWEYQGKVMAEIKFDVGGPRWRVWSGKTLLPQWTGEWRVSVIDGKGTKLGESSFNYTEVGAPQN